MGAALRVQVFVEFGLEEELGVLGRGVLELGGVHLLFVVLIHC